MKKGRSKQDYGTPLVFIRACEKRFGPIVCDLAASAENAKAPIWIDRETDTLTVPWALEHPTGTLYLNPEFTDIDPYAAKCAEESKRRQGLILLLTPASIGSCWFDAHVKGNAMVLGLLGRIPFDGMPVNPRSGRVDGYPKDLMLSVFGMGVHGFDTWRWQR